MSKPKISIVIPTLNEEKYLPYLLEDLEKQTYRNFEIIVSDSNSKDRTREIAKQFNVNIVEGGFIGIGRNNGAKAAIGSYLFFIDSDCRFDKYFIEKTLAYIEENDIDICLATFDELSKNAILKLNYYSMNIYQRLLLNTTFAFATGALMALSNESFKTLGGFDENVRRQVDSELFERAKKLKMKQGITPAKIYPSSRRYEKVGMFRTISTYIAGSFIMNTALARNRIIMNFFDRFSGGWGDWD